MEGVRKEIEEKENEEQGSSKIKTNQHVLNTTRNQAALFRKWIGTVRWIYNRCVEYVEHRKRQGNTKYILAKKHYRDLFLNSDSKVIKENPWLLNTPYDIRDTAVHDITNGISTNLKKVKKGTLASFSFKFRKKKDKNQSVRIEAKHYKYRPNTDTYLLYPDFWSKYKCESLRSQKKSVKLPKMLERDSRLVYERSNNRYVLAESVNYEVFDENRVPGGENQAAFAPIIALDPGVRTFQTGYDPRGYIFEFGKNDIGRIVRLCKFQDMLISQATRTCGRKRYKIKRFALPRMRVKIHNLVLDLHRKLASWLCSNYRYIILPQYEISKMVVKGHRKITRRTVRSMMTWSNYRFKQILKHKAKETSTTVYNCSEEYTSKTCTRCGTIKYNLGGSKTLTCMKCGLSIDRDYNGSRNIFLKIISETDTKRSVGG
jgi:putative transposase